VCADIVDAFPPSALKEGAQQSEIQYERWMDVLRKVQIPKTHHTTVTTPTHPRKKGTRTPQTGAPKQSDSLKAADFVALTL